MTLSDLIDELETPVTPIATFGGRVFGVLLILAPVTAAIVFIGKWSHWIGLTLSALVLFGTIFTAIEVVGAIHMRREVEVIVSASSVRYFICIKLIELLLFACSLAIIYSFLI